MKRKPLKRVKLSARVDLTENRFFSTVALSSDEIAELEDSMVDIEMLRVGVFKHRVYGELDITEEDLSSMVENFKNKIIGREVSFDWNHKAEAASGWLKELRIENGVLIGTTELTDQGLDSIESKEYGYFSIEYTDEFEDPETGDKHGPTILGGALTNRPFISKLKKVEFSLEDDSVSVYKLIKEESKMEKKEEKKPVVREPVIDDDKRVTLEEVQAKATELEKENEDLKKKLTEKGDGKQLEEFIAEQKKENEKMKKELETLQENNKILQAHSEDVISKNRALEIKTFCNELLTKNHHHPAIVDVVSEILMASPSNDKNIKLTETVGEGEDKKSVEIEVSLQDAIYKILEAIPKAQRADYTEKTTLLNGDQITEEEQTKLEAEGIKRAFNKRGIKLVKNG